jgi:hypothetical protein
MIQNSDTKWTYQAHASKDVYSENRSGWPLRIKGINMVSMIKVLPVQPYDNMGSVLFEQD